MPAIIDHAQRRREICDIAARLIARAGVEGVTIREVAREAGWSTNRVVHYFSSKHEMLLVTFREFSLRSLVQGEEALRSSCSLPSALEALLPLDAERCLSWQVWLAFWGMTASNPDFLAEQITRGRQVLDLIERLLIDRLGAVKPGLDWAFESERVLTLIVGIATQGVFDPDRWSAEKQRRHLAYELDSLIEATECRPSRI
jgi:AcrR family transcriptional regulator